MKTKFRIIGLIASILIIGAIYSVLAFALYSIISGTAEFNQVLGIEIVFSTLFGLFSGIIAVNVKK